MKPITLALAVALAGCAADTADSAGDSPLIKYDVQDWTHNAYVVPMCWHKLEQFDQYGSWATRLIRMEEAKDLVRRTVQSWLAPTLLRATWTDCPTTGWDQHVRVYIRAEYPGAGEGGTDISANGTTGSSVGMSTLSNAAMRANDVGNHLTGLLLGFPHDFYGANLADTKALILHEFGHVLGFEHESAHPLGDPAEYHCYAHDSEGWDEPGIVLGPPDPLSIMGWSYCNRVTGLSAGDIAGAQQVYGSMPYKFDGPNVVGPDGCGFHCRVFDVDGDDLGDLINPFGATGLPEVQLGIGGGFAPAIAWGAARCMGDCTVADVDGDGRGDLIDRMPGAVTVALSTGTGFGDARVWAGGCRDGEQCELGDVDGDGRADLVVMSHADRQVAVWRAGDGEFADPELWSHAACGAGDLCKLGDADGDGRTDLIAVTANGETSIAYADASRFLDPVSVESPCTPGSCEVGDVDGDGRADLVAFGDGVTVARASRTGHGFDPVERWADAQLCPAGDQCTLAQVDGHWGLDVIARDGTRVTTALASP